MRTFVRRTRRFRLAAIFSGLVLGAAVATASPKSFSIDSEEATRSLLDFGRQSTLQILFRSGEVKGIFTNAVHGDYEPIDALRLLLKGTPLVISEKSDGVLVVELQLNRSNSSVNSISTNNDDASTRLVQPGTTSAQSQSASGSPRSTKAPSSALEEIVVTAEKRESTVQKIPISITAITGIELEERGVNSAQGLATEVPGLSIESFGPGQGQYTLRGLSATGGEAQTIGFYLDEIAVTPPALATNGKVSIDPDLYDLERAEVLRGPQGTLYGAGAMGGTIKLVTKVADLSAFQASTQTTVSGTNGGGVNYGENGMVNLPLIAGTLALRIVGTYSHTDGWVHRIVVPNFPLESNPVPGFYGSVRGNVLASPASQIYKDVNDEDLQGARASLRFKPTDRLSVTAGIFYQRITQGGMNTFDSDPGTLAHYQPFDISEPYTDQFQVDSLTATLAFDPFTITSATGYWTRRSSQIEDVSEQAQNVFQLPSYSTAGGLGLGPVSAFEVDTTRQFSQEMRLTSNGEGRLQWIVGGYYAKFTSSAHGGSVVPGLLTLGGTGVGTDIMFGVYAPLTLIQRAAFVNMNFQFVDQFKLTAGLRYYSFSQSFSVSEAGLFGSGTATPTVSTAAASATGTNPTVTLSYTPTNNLLLYATAAKGFREGAGNVPVPTTGTVGSVCEQIICRHSD